MNALQRLVLLSGIVAVIGMGIYPPWTYTTAKLIPYSGEGIQQSEPAGFSFITRPPILKGRREDQFVLCGVTIDAKQLVAEEAIAVIATAMGVLLASSRKAKRTSQS